MSPDLAAVARVAYDDTRPIGSKFWAEETEEYRDRVVAIVRAALAEREGEECCLGANPACAGGCLVEKSALARAQELAERKREGEVLLDRLVALRRERNALREALWSRGFHSPGKCPHGTAHWVGDHCAYDCAALAPPTEGA